MAEKYKKRSLVVNGLHVLLVCTSAPVDVKDENRMSDDEEDPSDREGNSDSEGNSDQERAEMNQRDADDEDVDINLDNDTSSAAMAVGSGSFSDPPELPGLSHLLEHLLFLGSEKFCKSGMFERLLKNNEGSNGGHTGPDCTAYMFEITSSKFSKALEQFACMFTSPLFKKDRIKQEIEILDAELTLRLRNEGTIHDYMLTLMAKKDHPIGKFPWGTSESLITACQAKNIDIQQELKKHFKTHFVADRMSLVTMSGLSLSKQEKLIKKYFCDLARNTDESGKITGKCDDTKEIPYDPKKFNRVYKVTAPHQDASLYISWCLPADAASAGNGNFLSFICWVLNHKGAGTLNNTLIKKGYATCSHVSNQSNMCYCPVTNVLAIYTLSALGLENYSSVIELFFKYLHDFKELCQDEMEKLWKHMRSIDGLPAEASPTQSDIQIVNGLAIDQLKKIDTLLGTNSSDARSGDAFNYNQIRDVLNCICATNMNIVLFSPNLKDSERTKYGKEVKVHYSDEAISKDLLKLLNDIASHEATFKIPRKNRFMPKNFDIKSSTVRSVKSSKGKPPRKISHCDSECQYVLYYKDGAGYDTSMVSMYFHLKNQVLNSNVQQSCISDIFVRALNLHLSDILFEGKLVAMKCRIETTDNGIVIHFNGFAHKMGLFVKEVIKRIADFEMEPLLFTTAVGCVRNAYLNTMYNPDLLLDSMRQTHLNVKSWSTENKLQQIKAITLDNYKKIDDIIQNSTKLECLAQGNITSDEACDLAEYVFRTLGLCGCEFQECECWCPIRMIPVGDFCISNKNKLGDENFKIQNYYQIYDIDRSLSSKKISLSETLVELLAKLMDEPSETFLRARCALGYSIYVSALHDDPAHGVAVTVHGMSSRFSADIVENYIDLFVQEFLTENIQSLSEEIFQQYVSITKNHLSDDGLIGEAIRNWTEIQKGRYIFSKLSQQLDQLDCLSLSAFKRWVVDLLSDCSKHRRKLCIQVLGNANLTA